MGAPFLPSTDDTVPLWVQVPHKTRSTATKPIILCLTNSHQLVLVRPPAQTNVGLIYKVFNQDCSELPLIIRFCRLCRPCERIRDFGLQLGTHERNHL